MESSVNTSTVVYATLCSIAGMIVTLFAYQFLYLNDKMDFTMDEKFEAREYVTAEQLDLSVSKAVFEEREAQAEAKTASLSRGIADEMGWERSDVASKAGKVFKFGYEQMALHEQREGIWQEFIRTKFIGVIEKPNQMGVRTLYYRDSTDDYLIQYEIVNGERHHYWQDANMIKHPLRERDKIKTVHLPS